MKRVLINRLIEIFEQQINDVPRYNDIIDSSPPFTIDTANFNEFKGYVMNGLKK